MMINAANVAVCLLLALACAWAVLSPRVHDGVVIKTGITSMGLGFAALAMHLLDGLQVADHEGIERAILLINLGILIAVLGVLLRIRSRPQSALLLCEWIDLR